MGPVMEDIGTTFILGGCVRVCLKGGWGFASFNRIEDASRNALAAYEMAKLTAGDKTLLYPVDPVVDTIRDEVAKDPTSITLEEKQELGKKYNDLMLQEKGIVTTQVNYRDNKKDALAFIKEFKVTYPNGPDEDNISSDYGLTGVPETFVVNTDGEITEHILGATTLETLSEAIDKVL